MVVTCCHCRSQGRDFPCCPTPRSRPSVFPLGMRELSRVHYHSLSITPAIDNINSTKPALGSTERCCRFNQAGLLRNDRPLLLRFPKPVPVPVPAFLLMLWSLLPVQILCCAVCALVCLGVCACSLACFPLLFCSHLLPPNSSTPTFPVNCSTNPPSLVFNLSGWYDSHPSQSTVVELPPPLLSWHQELATVPIEPATSCSTSALAIGQFPRSHGSMFLCVRKSSNPKRWQCKPSLAVLGRPSRPGRCMAAWLEGLRPCDTDTHSTSSRAPTIGRTCFEACQGQCITDRGLLPRAQAA